jgi:hypothetical protein
MSLSEQFSRSESQVREKGSTPIIVVSGLPRSGTSMMMKMLEAGGLDLVIDGQRRADEDNPKGYYEFERVKQLNKGDQDWLPEAQGKGVKIISALLQHLPSAYTYRVIFMEREMQEILASQKKMLVRRAKPTDQVDDETLAALYGQHLAKVQAWLAAQPFISVLPVSYNQLLQEPYPYLHRLNQFLEMQLDVDKMAVTVDPALYRNQAGL